MPDQYFNPFQTTKIYFPQQFHEEITRFCQTGGRTDIDKQPFPKMIDFWFCAICLAVRQRLKPDDLKNYPKRIEITDGSTLSNEHWRIHLLMLIAINHFDNVDVVSDPIEMMALANGLAISGYPILLEILNDKGSDPIWNLSDSLYDMLKEENN